MGRIRVRVNTHASGKNTNMYLKVSLCQWMSSSLLQTNHKDLSRNAIPKEGFFSALSSLPSQFAVPHTSCYGRFGVLFSPNTLLFLTFVCEIQHFDPYKLST